MNRRRFLNLALPALVGTVSAPTVGKQVKVKVDIVRAKPGRRGRLSHRRIPASISTTPGVRFPTYWSG